MNYLIVLIIGLTLSSHSEAEDARQILSLTEYLKLVAAQSPDLKIENALNSEAQARTTGVRINPPMVGLMNMKDSSGTNRGIEISQEIPFPTKITNEKETRNLEAKAQESSSNYRKNEILLMARSAYFEFWLAIEKLEIVKEKKEWLTRHSKIARSATRSDSSAQVHLLGIESEVDLLENEVLQSETDLIEKRNALKIFAPDLKSSDFIPTEPKLELVQVDSKIKSSLIVWKESELESAEANQKLKKQDSLPDFFIRYRGYNGNETTAKSEEVMVGITIPFLFSGASQAASNEAAAKYQRVQAELQKIKIELDSKLQTLFQNSESLKKQLVTLNEKLIPRAHKRMKLVDNLSPRTMEALSEHRVVMLDYLQLREKAIQTRANYENNYLEILKLTSHEVFHE